MVAATLVTDRAKFVTSRLWLTMANQAFRGYFPMPFQRFADCETLFLLSGAGCTPTPALGLGWSPWGYGF